VRRLGNIANPDSQNAPTAAAFPVFCTEHRRHSAGERKRQANLEGNLPSKWVCPRQRRLRERRQTLPELAGFSADGRRGSAPELVQRSGART
jgi:hypothetical protein